MVRDRQPLEVGRERVVRPDHAAHVARVVDGGVEVGVVTNARGHAVFGFGLRHEARAQRVHARAARAGLEQVEQRVAQRAPGGRAHGQKFIEGVARAGIHRLCRRARHRVVARNGRQVDHLVANGHASAKRFAGCLASEHAEGQVLDREVGARCVGGFQPAAGAGVVRVVEFHGVQAAVACNASSKMATARVQPAEAPRILCGKHEMKKPSAGSASRLCSFSMWQ